MRRLWPLVSLSLSLAACPPREVVPGGDRCWELATAPRFVLPEPGLLPDGRKNPTLRIHDLGVRQCNKLRDAGAVDPVTWWADCNNAFNQEVLLGFCPDAVEAACAEVCDGGAVDACRLGVNRSAVERACAEGAKARWDVEMPYCRPLSLTGTNLQPSDGGTPDCG
ncbi:MAG: hypothetical protein IPJ65_41645 [Archangiaceae bacterium]|nr:hypothetical protein [Archangiaceae bacterium]